MKKFIFCFIFIFSFIFVGLSYVNASELELNSLGYSSCLDSNDNIVFTCDLDSSNGSVVFYDSENRRVSNYFLVSDSFQLYLSSGSYASRICFYDKDYVFISCNTKCAISSCSFVMFPLNRFSIVF